MKYTQVTFRLQGDATPMVEVLVAVLAEIHFDSFEETTNGITAYCPTALFDETVMHAAIAALPTALQYDYRIADMPDIDWNATWEQNSCEPIDIDGRCIIHNTRYRPTKPYEYDIIVNPQQAFGSGSHETTRLVIKSLMNTDLHEKTVLDMGCGTGILSIFAAIRGAKSVMAIDIDEWSVQNTADNCRLNDITCVTVKLGSIETIENRKFDLILANINRNILLAHLPMYANALNENGSIIISGFYSTDVPMLQTQAHKYGLHCQYCASDNDWTTLTFVKR
ncbi:MAG: 50S ribosomal protein L11 methyltransferase [Paludibacteraceae bacterium]